MPDCFELICGWLIDGVSIRAATTHDSFPTTYQLRVAIQHYRHYQH